MFLLGPVKGKKGRKEAVRCKWIRSQEESRTPVSYPPSWARSAYTDLLGLAAAL